MDCDADWESPDNNSSPGKATLSEIVSAHTTILPEAHQTRRVVGYTGKMQGISYEVFTIRQFPEYAV